MNITLEQYQKEALKVLNEQIAKSKKEQARYCCMGMLEESGEIVSELRKAFFKGNFHEKNIDKEAVTSECGDLLWYMALMCEESEIDIEQIDAEVVPKTGEEDREELISKGIMLGKRTGRTVQRYLQYHRGEIPQSALERSLRKQYRSMKKLLRELNITIDNVIENNLQKIRHRYECDREEEI